VTAQLEGVDSAQPSAPTPRAIYAQWFPAHVVLPDSTTRSNVRVFVTDTGLLIFDHRPDAAYVRGAEADQLAEALFYSPMNWAATLVDQPRLPQPRVGFVLATDAGPVAVTPQLGCGCHLRGLKNWVPSWTGRSLPWGEVTA
jgi:hypothetical protein